MSAYYLLHCTYTPLACDPIQYNPVISEPPTKFMVRNLKYIKEMCGSDRLIVDFIKPIDVKEYNQLKEFNPKNSYLRFNKEDG